MKLADGYTLMHEHVTINLSGVKKDEDCRLNCFEETVKEFKGLYGYGLPRASNAPTKIFI